jgi:uncharacterized membrane protein
MSSIIHHANIALHIACGTLALVIGLVMIARPKGDALHRKLGRVFVALVCIVVASATFGIVFFRHDVALSAITVLVGYQLFSGIRAIRSKGAMPRTLDTVLAIVALVAGCAFLIYLKQGNAAFWRPAVTTPLAGWLIFVSSYDLVRLVFPARWRLCIWTVEHGVKLIFTIGGLASAAAGTITPQLAPWSQIGPSAVFGLVVIGYLAIFARAQMANALARANTV